MVSPTAIPKTLFEMGAIKQGMKWDGPRAKFFLLIFAQSNFIIRISIGGV